MNDTRRIFGAFMIAIALFAFWPAVVGGWKKVQALNTALAERQELLDSRSKIFSGVDAASTEYNQNLTGIIKQKFSALVPTRKSTAELLSAIQAIARDSALQLGEVAFSESAQGSTSEQSQQFQTLEISVQLTGSYPDMRQFLVGLEKYVRILKVKTIDVAVATDGGQLKFNITADAYFLK